jgi:hypothetical protein
MGLQIFNPLLPILLRLFGTERTGVDNPMVTLFLQDLEMIELCLFRVLGNRPQVRPPNQIEFDRVGTSLDSTSFYLYSYKALLSSLAVSLEVLSHEARRGLPRDSYSRFIKVIETSSTTFAGDFRTQIGQQLNWVETQVIAKRNNMIQHWPVKVQNQLFPTTYLHADAAIVAYAHQTKDFENGPRQEIRRLFQPAAQRRGVTGNFSPKHELALLEFWADELPRSTQREIQAVSDDEIQVTLPVTEALVARLEEYLEAKLLLVERHSGR